MKRFTFVLLLLLITAVIISAQENYILTIVTDHAVTDGLFSGVSGRELSPSEMKQKDGDWVTAFLTVYAACSITYGCTTGRSLEKDAYRFIVKPTRRATRRAFRKSWRERGSRRSRRLYIRY